VATVNPNSVTFNACGDVKTLTVTPQSAGSATISLTQTANTTAGSFNLAPATFTVNVSPPPNTAPAVTVGGVTGGASYDKGSVPAAICNVVDAEDGNSSFPATLSAITGPYASDGIGSQTASCSYTDDGPGTGLTASASETYGIVDPSAPVIGYTLDPASADGSNGWYKGDVDLTWNVSEPQSPNSLQKTGCVNQSITADQVATTYSCSATSAGGSAGPETVTIKRDGTAPDVTLGAVSGTAGTNGWYTSAIDVEFRAADGLSGFSGKADPHTFTVSSGTQQGAAVAVASGTVTDLAGNTADSVNSGPFKVDSTKPSLNPVVSPNPVLLNGTATASPGASDATSGIASANCDPVNTSSVGAKSVNCSATDNAGNQNSASANYNVNYNFAGFRAPVDNNGVFNTAKAGSAIPMKFSLFGNHGLGVIATGFPKATAVTCPRVMTTDLIEETVNTTSNSFTYDATADQYNYVWKTQSTYAGKCYRFDLQLIDGTTQSALFNFTK
jgi:hypothetical protein